MYDASASPVNPWDFVIRVMESTAFSLHAILGLSEPWTGCLRAAFRDGGALPVWCWPVAGAMLLGVAIINFTGNNTLILAAQAYVCAFHMGGFFYHVRLGHHPAIGLAPALFAVFAFALTALRTNVVVALIQTVICTAVAAVLCRILVHPPASNRTESSNALLDGHQQQQGEPRE